METQTIQPKRGRPPRESAKNEAVRAVRTKLKLTQQQMAARLECGISTIQKLEGARVLPGVAALNVRFQKLADEAGVNISDYEVKET